jgi:hypothetical protein
MRLFVIGAHAIAVTAALSLPIGTFTISAAAQDGDAVTVTGIMSDAGVECGAMRGDDGVLYTFRRTIQIRQFHPGDRIRIEGRVQPASTCQQGTTLAVTHAEKIN